ncbi:MAG: YiaA/YiaB family inner membrane protein, partial [Chloroflexi bacterium]|nr:YiaA/YiaB family inner membrane protein [Chloroflexota bacterium]
MKMIEMRGPSVAFVMVSWVVLAAGMIAYFAGLWNSDMELNEKGYYLVVLLYALFSVISVQKSIRDRLEGRSGYEHLLWIGLG